MATNYLKINTLCLIVINVVFITNRTTADMILTHFPDSSLIAKIKTYNIILMYKKSKNENLIRERDECIRELHTRYDLHKEK